MIFIFYYFEKYVLHGKKNIRFSFRLTSDIGKKALNLGLFIVLGFDSLLLYSRYRFFSGLEPVTVSPNKEICMALLAAQELFAIVATASYDATFLFLFAHTAAMFEVLSEETMALNDLQTSELDDGTTVMERLKNLITRHSLLLHTVEKIQEIYSITIGISFALEAITMCLFFVLPLDVCLNFAPVIFHGLFLFFLYCYQGQKITTAAERFEKAVYCSGWQNFGIKDQKMILFMLKQSQRPVILLAASVVPVRIYTFAYTMQSIYKFVTVFKT